MYNRTPLKERMRLQSRRDDATGCILWTGTTNYGYGILNAFGKMMKAHRVAWIMRYGPIPDGLCICHKCDVPACINTDHLFLGTYADNTRDMIRKGRGHKSPRGVRVLSPAQMEAIRKDRRAIRVVAKDFHVSHMTIQKVRRGVPCIAPK
jgi:hypothetical protein